MECRLYCSVSLVCSYEKTHTYSRNLGIVSSISSTVFTLEYQFTTSQTVSSQFTYLSANRRTDEQGLTNLGGLLGAAIGTVFTSYLLDGGAIWLARRNRGVYEPEFRLVLMLTMLFGVFGYIGWASESCNLPRHVHERLILTRFSSQLAINMECLG